MPIATNARRKVGTKKKDRLAAVSPELDHVFLLALMAEANTKLERLLARAPTVRFICLEMLITRVLAFECAFKARCSSLLHGLRFTILFAVFAT